MSAKVESKLLEAGAKYMQEAEEGLRKKEYGSVGGAYFKCIAAFLQAACQRQGIPFGGKEDYFRVLEELTARTGVDWAEKTLCQAMVLVQNDEQGILTNDQVRRFSQEVRRLARWLKGLAEKED